jgi:hypothetical protein
MTEKFNGEDFSEDFKENYNGYNAKKQPKPFPESCPLCQRSILTLMPYHESVGGFYLRCNSPEPSDDCDPDDIIAALNVTQADMLVWNQQIKKAHKSERQSHRSSLLRSVDNWQTEVKPASTKPKRLRKGKSKRNMKWLTDDGLYNVEVRRINEKETPSRYRCIVLCQVTTGTFKDYWVRRCYSYTDPENLADNSYMRDAEVALGRKVTDDDDLDFELVLMGKQFVAQVGGPINEKMVKEDSKRYKRVHRFIHRLT